MTPRITINDVRAILAGGLVDYLLDGQIPSPVLAPMGLHRIYMTAEQASFAMTEAAATIQSLAQAFIEMDAELVAAWEALVEAAVPLEALLMSRNAIDLNDLSWAEIENGVKHIRAIIKGTDHAE